MADNEAVGLRFDVSGGGSVNGESGRVILEQIQGIVKGIESSGVTKLKFKVDTSDLKNVSTKVKQATDGLSNSNYGKGLVNYYKDLDKAADNFNKKNLNAIDFEIKARESAGKTFSSQIKAQMQTQQEAINLQSKAQQDALKQNVSSFGIAQANSSYSKLGNTVDELKNAGKITDEISNQFKRATIAKEAFDKAPTKSNLDAYKAEATSLNTLTNNLKNVARVQEQNTSNAKQFKDILAQSRGEYDKYSDSIKKNSSINEKWQKLNSSLANGTYTGTKMQARDDLAELDKELYDAGLKTETFRQKIANLFDQHLSTAAVLVGVHLIQQGIQGIYQNVVDLDKALVNIQIATGYTRDQTKELISGYSQFGKEMGATTTEVANAADSWLRMGYSVSDSNTLVKDSLMLAKLGEIDTASASKDLVSAMKGYGLEVSDMEDVVSKFTSVDKSAAVDAGYLAEALSETATSAKLAGISMNDMIGYIAAVGETTQQSSEQVGNGFKSILARMGNIKSGNLVDPEDASSLKSWGIAA